MSGNAAEVSGAALSNLKRASCLRRAVIPPDAVCVAVAGKEGAVCAFEVGAGSKPLIVEGPSGRAVTLVPGDVFLATPGFRESTRFIVGGLPPEGLQPDNEYWILSPSGVVGELFGSAPLEQVHLGQVTYLGAVHSAAGEPLSIQRFCIPAPQAKDDRGAPIFLVLGTSAEIGKTTAALAVLRSLFHRGNDRVVALKATGTSSIVELLHYLDFGAVQAFDCVDFGLPTTYPSERDGIGPVFDRSLDVCLSMPCDALLIECGGDILGANVPVFLERLVERRRDMKVILAAPDALAAMGAQLVLRGMGVTVTLITGPCTDTPTLQQRTQTMCETPAMNLAQGAALGGVPAAGPV